MEGLHHFEVVWGNNQMPVLIFGGSGDSLRQVYANDRAKALFVRRGELQAAERPDASEADMPQGELSALSAPDGEISVPVGADGAASVSAAADGDMPGPDLFGILSPKEALDLRNAVLSADGQGGPHFCHVKGKVYSAVLFDWEAYRVCLLQDVSRYYQDVRQKLDDAILANRAKTNFLSEISHDIRTPMNAIIGMTDIALMQKEMPARVAECLSKIKIASGHMMSLLNEVLDMSRIESGRVILNPERLDVADLLHEVLIVARPQADAAKLRFGFRLGRMDRECVMADGVRIRQICLNLLSNAVKFTPAGGHVELFLEVREAEKPGKVWMEIRVKDSGIGMSREFMNRLFTPFEREQTVTVSKIQGTGLGMAITKSLAELMDGTVEVESRQGEGTQFRICLLLDAAEDNAALYRQALEGKRALFLCAEEEQSALLAGMLDRLGMEIVCVKNEEQAVYEINDAFFSDAPFFAFLTAEQVDGVEMMQFLPEIRRRMGREFPMLMLSEGDWSQIEYMLTRSGVDAFIPLPLFFGRLAEGLYAFTPEGRLAQNAEKRQEKWDFAGRRILLVEDNEINREIATELLSVSGVEIETAGDGVQAVERFSSVKPYYYDLVLMDIQMPVMDGLEATRRIRGLDRPDARVTPIVAMTANAFVEDVQRSRDAGMDEHLSKPLDMDQVFACLNRFLGRGRA